MIIYTGSMRKEILNSKVSIAKFDDDIQFSVELDKSDSSKLLNGLNLLKLSQIEALVIQFSKCCIVFTLNNSSFGKVLEIKLENGNSKLSISRNQIEYIDSFLGKYIRNGFADVQHIDIDFTDTGDSGFTLTLIVEHYKLISINTLKKRIK